jgi:hypothetical protein
LQEQPERQRIAAADTDQRISPKLIREIIGMVFRLVVQQPDERAELPVATPARILLGCRVVCDSVRGRFAGWNLRFGFLRPKRARDDRENCGGRNRHPYSVLPRFHHELPVLHTCGGAPRWT